MKYSIMLCVLGMVTSALGGTVGQDRGCVYIGGGCHRQCPEGTYGYAPEGGCGQRLPESTCDDPHPVLEGPIICDYSACYCDPPTVRDTVSKKCVKLEECPKKE